MNRLGIGMAACAVLFLSACGPPSSTSADARKWKIAVPDESAGLIVEYLIHEKGVNCTVVTGAIAVYPIKDCCTANMEWALSSGELDMAIMCPDAAARLIQKDARFAILGPCMINSDVIILAPAAPITGLRIAVSHRRHFQRQMVYSAFGSGSRPVPMLHAGVAFAYAKGVVDGAVMDALKGFYLKGKMIQPGETGRDWTTYVFVVKKAFQQTPDFKDFMAVLKDAVHELNQPTQLRQALKKYRKTELTDEMAEQWKILNIKFVHPFDSRP